MRSDVSILAPATKKPPRRTQEERSAAMARALLDSTVACILEFGVTGATVARIARRANATAGSVQHHFGTRDGLLLGVVAEFGDRLTAVTQATPHVDASLEERVDAVCDASWNVVSSSHYRAVIQILLAVQEKEDLYSRIFDRLKGFEHELDALWLRIFEGSGLDDSQIAPVRHIVMAAFRGFAIRMIYRSNQSHWTEEIHMLKAMVVRALAR